MNILMSILYIVTICFAVLMFKCKSKQFSNNHSTYLTYLTQRSAKYKLSRYHENASHSECSVYEGY